MKNSILQYLRKHGFRSFCPEAVLFDMDGVLFDSMPNHAVSWHESMATFGLEIPLEGAYRYEGMRGVETIKLLAREQWHRELIDDEAQRMYEAKSALFARQPAPQKMDGIEHLMQQIHKDGMTIGVVTGSGQHTLLDQLEKGFMGFVRREHIVTSYDVTHGKPAPDPYLAGMRKCGVQPWQTIVVENAPLGILSAVAAGCFTIGVNTGPLADNELLAAGCDLLLADISHLDKAWADIVKATRQTDDSGK